MTKPSLISAKILQHINSIVWLQSKGIQEPLKPDVIVNNVAYPPNVIAEKPVTNIEVITNSSMIENTGGVRQFLCKAVFEYTIVWVFSREVYKTYHQIPRSQIQDLLVFCQQFVISAYQGIDPDITNIDLKPSQVLVKPTEDVNSDVSNSSSWSVVADLRFMIEFLTSLDEFLPIDFNKIQPPTWELLDDLDPIVPEQPFTLNGLIISLNKSELPKVRADESDTYQLEEILYIPPTIEDQI
ncbi:hypothetical protein [Nostoc phage A1]|uniref:Uncharacterized protein n=1 Tax=Nostoc phage A1 TaxID=1775256 RepID=A0ACD6B8W0_9CAUD|nr:hypothetical protein [Nostoc phage A1]